MTSVRDREGRTEVRVAAQTPTATTAFMAPVASEGRGARTSSAGPATRRPPTVTACPAADARREDVIVQLDLD
ncbi:hypothetical protein ABZ793_26020 [Micromonospora sp. NPDC047465]|uniref:hypothetical protein n=1 Tax=Micromonospora sp. NPDC047465 TaxID=3154813 RepID=UPI0033DFB305